MGTDIHQSITLRDYLKVVFKHKLVIITTIVVVMLTIYISLSLYTVPYKATAKMIVEGQKTKEAEYYERLLYPSKTLVEGEIIKSNPVLFRVVVALQLYNLPLDYEKRFSSRLKALLIDYKVKKLKQELEKLPKERREAILLSQALNRLVSSIDVSQVKDTNMFTVTVYDYSPVGAVILANSVSRSNIIYDLERQLAETRLKYGEKHSIARQIKDKIEELNKTLDGKPLPDLEAIGPGSVKIIEQAKESSRASRYNENLLLNVGFILSLVMGLILAYGFEYMDQSIKSPQDVERFLSIPFLGSIPKVKTKNKPSFVNANPHPAIAKFYQDLSGQLDLLIKDKQFRSILITDAEAAEDTVSVVANIGIFFAHKTTDYRVLIIDANLRNPSIYKIFNISNSPGVVDVVEGKILFADALQDVGSNLYILTSGRTEFNPTTLLSSSRMSELINTAKEKYELIFLICSDLKNFRDAIILSSFTDAFILVVNEGGVRRQVIQYSLSPLVEKKVNIMGAILNNRKLAIPKFIYDRI